MAIAPTATSSIIMGNTSPSVEPFRANTYRQDTLSGSFLNINKNLLRILSQRLNDQELKEVLSNIIAIEDQFNSYPIIVIGTRKTGI